MKAEARAVGLSTLVVYLALLPFAAQTWLRSGDEPHYLLLAHSLAFDGDLDLRNHYDHRDYSAFYTSADLDRHVFTRADGAQFLTHNPGLAFLIAPVYRLGGYRGALILLAALGALLAANVYALCLHVTGNRTASLAGWFVASFCPPVLWYVFLVYPEMPGALCALLAVRALVERKNGILFGIALTFMPWLSARFIPIEVLLFAAGAWLAWRTRSRSLAIGLLLAALGSAAYIFFNFAIYGSLSPAASYAGPAPLAVDTSYLLTRLPRGLLGWLVDQQRGLLLFSPIYLIAFVGFALLLLKELKEIREPRELPTKRHFLPFPSFLDFLPSSILIALPFLLGWLTTSLWGGFFVGYELGGRFIVSGLPLLGVGVAWAVARVHRPALLVIGLPLLAFSLWAGSTIFRDPLIGYQSTVFEYLREKRNWNLNDWLPSLGSYAFISPGGEGMIAVAGAPGLWETPATEGFVARDDHIRDLSFGWYALRFHAAIPASTSAGAPIASLLVSQPDETPLLSELLHAEDFPRDGSFREFNFRFHTPEYNQWEKPPRIWLFSTGAAPLKLSRLEVEPEGFHAWGLPLLWLGGFAGLGLALALGALKRSAGTQSRLETDFHPAAHRRIHPASASQPMDSRVPRSEAERGSIGLPRASAPNTNLQCSRFASKLSLVFALASLLLVRRAFLPLPREYHFARLLHLAGREVTDPRTKNGVAVVASPARGDERNKLAVTRPELYPAGRYRLTVWLRVGLAEPGGDKPIAGLQVFGSRTPSVAALPVWPDDFPADDAYHPVILEFEDPVEQFLTLQVNYTGVAELAGDRIRIEPVR